MPAQATAEKIIPFAEGGSLTISEAKTPETLKSKGYRRPILEILADLQKPIPKRFIKSKTLKGQRIDFVSWYSYIRLLEFYAPGFSWEVRTHYNGDRTVIEGRLILRAAEGNFIREATGTEDNEIDSWGDPSSNAEAMALRRCCAKFGLGLHLWEK
jgi:TATA-binding protein-associated factor Taf7